MVWKLKDDQSREIETKDIFFKTYSKLHIARQKKYLSNLKTTTIKQYITVEIGKWCEVSSPVQQTISFLPGSYLFALKLKEQKMLTYTKISLFFLPFLLVLSDLCVYTINV